MGHWIVLIAGIIALSLGFISGIDYYVGGQRSELFFPLAIFLAIVARIVQADIHHKSQKQG